MLFVEAYSKRKINGNPENYCGKPFFPTVYIFDSYIIQQPNKFDEIVVDSS